MAVFRYLVLVFVLFAAIIGEASASEIFEAPSALCFLSYNTNSGEVRCSSVLLSKNFVVTAAHCFPNKKSEYASDIRIKCGLLSQSKGGENFSFSEEFSGNDVKMASTGHEGAGVDFAFVHLNRPSKSSLPMELAGGLEAFRSEFMTPSSISAGDFEIKQDIECRSSGFGFDSVKKKSYFLTSDQSPQHGLRVFQSAADDHAASLVIYSYGGNVAQFRHGDSGGAFYCRSPEDGKYKLIGIISSGLENESGANTGSFFLAATTSNYFLGIFDHFLSIWK